jgi:hypothetical protein
MRNAKAPRIAHGLKGSDFERGRHWCSSKSSTSLAKAMTGTSWNRHHFFGLQTAKSDCRERRKPEAP